MVAIIGLILGAALVGAFALHSRRQDRRLLATVRAFAAVLEDGKVIPGARGKGPRATGRWKGTEVEVGFFARLHPSVFLTSVRVGRLRSPFAALLVPRTSARSAPPADAPAWIVELDRVYDAGCGPEELFRQVVDADTARSLAALSKTEIEILPDHVTVQRREAVSDPAKLVPLLDAAAHLSARLDALHADMTGSTDDDQARRESEVRRFLAQFRRRA